MWESCAAAVTFGWHAWWIRECVHISAEGDVEWYSGMNGPDDRDETERTKEYQVPSEEVCYTQDSEGNTFPISDEMVGNG
jgi:hypothetical protein